MHSRRGLISLEEEIGSRDASNLDPLTEESLLTNFYQRFNRDQIYVSMKLFHLNVANEGSSRSSHSSG